VADRVVELRFLWHTPKKIINRCQKKEAAEGCGRGGSPTTMTGTRPWLIQHNVVSRVMIGKYEREEAVPSIDAAKKIADALEVSMDNLVGEGIYSTFDKKTLQRLKAMEHLEEDKKRTLFDLIDTYIRDAKARKAYA